MTRTRLFGAGRSVTITLPARLAAPVNVCKTPSAVSPPPGRERTMGASAAL